MKSLYSKYGIFENKYLIGAFILGTLMQITVVAIPQIAEVFKLVPLTHIQWIYTIGISFVPIMIVELQKKLNGIKFGKVIYQNVEVKGKN